MASPTLSLDNEVFAKFAFYAGVVLLKTVFMGIWTARFRIANKVCGSIDKNKDEGKNVKNRNSCC